MLFRSVVQTCALPILSVFCFQRRFIDVQAHADGRLDIVANGPLVHVMGFEIFVLYIINELYFRRLPQQGVLDEARRRLLPGMDRT